MFFKYINKSRLFLVGIFLMAGCGSPTDIPAQEPIRPESLTLSLLYPNEESDIEMGQAIKAIVRVTDEQGQAVKNANVSLTIKDQNGQVVSILPATFGDGDVYRSELWEIPHHMLEGLWSVQMDAESASGRGKNTSNFPVKYSTSEILYHKYGFWLDKPTLRGIQPMIGAERGDAENGLIRWGGVIPSQHILPEVWVEVQWRKGDFKLNSPERVREFMLDDIGDLGFTPVREIGEFERTTFNRWDAWQAPVRGQLYYREMKLTVFYAPEVDKTYAVATSVIHAPSNIEAHEFLLKNFDIDPDVDANGVAPTALMPLLPQPRLVSPELGKQYTGLEEPITLVWEPVKELAEDEYYQVAIDFDYTETNNKVKYATRETRFTLPESLYRTPNCAVFNWRITLMRQTGAEKNGNPKGEALSYDSLYRYVQWFYPDSAQAPFDPRCPNALY